MLLKSVDFGVEMPLWLPLVCVILCLCAFLWYQEQRMRKPFEKLSRFPLLPLIGNLHQVRGDGRGLFLMLDEASDICERTDSAFVLWLGPCPILATHDVDDIKTITNSLTAKPYYYDFGKSWLGDGLVTAPASIWKQNIKKLAGTLTGTVVNGYLDVFNAQAFKLVSNLRTKVDQEPFDIIHTFLAYTTLEAVCHTTLGVHKTTDNLLTTEYYEAFDTCLALLIERGLNIFKHPDWVYRYTNGFRTMEKCVAVLHNVSDTVIKKRKLQRAENRLNNSAENMESAKFKSFLDILLEVSESDPSLTEKQIQAEVDTIIVAGHETVATAIFYVLLMVGCKKEVQDKLYAEMNSIFGGSKRTVEKEDLAQMRYCEAVINETLRLYPSVPVVMRLADREVALKSCTVPKGTACAINVWGAGRSERIWGPDAKVYRPERWMEDQPPRTAGFLAFSCGRRACIGKKYAMTIMKTMLAHCIREFEFISEAERMEFKMDIALRPISGYLIKVRLRDNGETSPN